MNHKKALLTALLTLVVSTCALAQPKAASEENTSLPSFISFNLTTPIDPFGPRFRMGYIQSINEQWMVGMAFGYGSADIRLIGSVNRFFDAYQLWEVRPELYYFPNPKDRWNTYASAELFYINHTDQLENDQYQPSKDSSLAIRYDRVDYQRQKYGLNIKSGVILNLIGPLKLNAYCGIGVRVRNNDFDNPVNPQANPDFIDEFGFTDAYLRRAGTFVGVNFSMGLNLFYEIK